MAGARGDEEGQRPFPGQSEDAEQEVEELQDGHGPHARVEGGGEEVEEEFRPEEGVDGGQDLVGGRGEDDEPGPVVFDQFAHGFPPPPGEMRRVWLYKKGCDD